MAFLSNLGDFFLFKSASSRQYCTTNNSIPLVAPFHVRGQKYVYKKILNIIFFVVVHNYVLLNI